MYKLEDKIIENKAISLIALIITIIVLLILAGITINGITGNESVLENAKQTKDKADLDNLKKQVQLAVIDSYSNSTGDLDIDTLKTNLQSKGMTVINNKFPLNVMIGEDKCYIEEDGQVSYTGYVQKEYIKSTGTQYIDTEVNPANTLDLEITFKTDVDSMTVGDKGTYAVFFGTQNKDINRTFSFNFGATKGQKQIFTWKNNTYSNGAAIIGLNTTTYNPINTITLTCINNIWKANGSKLGTAASVGDWKDEDNTLIVFGISRIENSTKTISPFYENMYLYSLKLWDNGTLIRDYIPVISLESGHENEPCLFDKVEGKFYYNQGTGTFQIN